MTGPATSPKPFDSLVLSNLSSPRFDISDFLKTPTDGSPKEKEAEEDDALFSTFQGFTLPSVPFICAPPLAAAGCPQSHVHHHLHNITTPAPIAAAAPPPSVPDSHGREHPEGDSSAAPLLFEDCKGADFNMDHVLNHGELIPFDDYIDGVLDGGDSFSIFNDVNYNTSVSSNAASNLGYVPYLSAESGMMMLPSLSGPSVSLYAPPEPYLGSEAGSLVEVGDHVLVGLDHRASTSGAPSSLLYPNSQLDWGVANHGAPFSGHLGQPGSLQCESCQLLRRIIHSNGVQDTKLEIHGRHGQSYHAVLQTRFCIDDGFPSTLEQQMVDFPVGNSEYVKQFLLQYSMLRSKEGFILRHDSLQVPMDLSCIASERLMGGPNMQMLNQPGQSKLTNGNCSTDPADPSALPVKPPKSNAAAQRERTGKLKMSDLAQFFHLPINAAAKELGICPTVLKKICRRNGMRRWPHRKIKSIERIIATLEQTIAEGAGQGDESIRMEIAMLRNERAQLCAGLLGEK
ncbi:hypothetical protein GOP47_0006036 [Adiantum capillus-veneris]|uniref:RWP-RK domain-containing protein n=1 Tax=Adiantum capillus-veneris TaxID=13818 RepID=A0A9D4V2P3_ADICA|nr:hypothetical protein GOP47_0006036 [Adiantum capillus-veneris]